MTPRRRILVAFLLFAAAGAWLLEGASPARCATSTLQWLSPTSSSNIRIARRLLGAKAGPTPVDSGLPSKYCPSSVTVPEGTRMSCQLPAADTAYQYTVCMRDAANEDLGGFECTYHGNGGGWECSPTDIGASWCD